MSGLRRALLALAVLAFLCGAATVPIILGSNHEDSRGLLVALTLSTGWGFAFTGLYAWARRPDSKIGPLMTAIGFTFFCQGFAAANNPVLFAIGTVGSTLPYGILIHLLVSFPSGRLEGQRAKLTVGLGYLVTGPLQLIWAVLTDPGTKSDCTNCPENPVLVSGYEGVAEAIVVFQVVAGIAAILLGLWILVSNWRQSPASERRALTPVVVTGGIAFAILVVQLILVQFGLPTAVKDVIYAAVVTIFACLPFAFLIGLLRSRLGHAEEVSTALSAENAELTAELEAKVAELRASRHRIVEAGYAERRRVERDLHDGAQQRLMALTMNLRLARDKVDAEPAMAAELLDEALVELGEATAELRELARGIHPVVLSDRGLQAAIGGLAERSPVPVEVLETPAERLPAPVESATYFVVAEALTNVARYAEASGATVRVARRNGAVEVEIRDDGIGGADPATGTGLRGLEDRVAALDGELSVESPAGAGTRVEARIPCG